MAQEGKKGRSSEKRSENSLGLSNVSMSKKAVINSHHLTVFSRTMLFTSKAISTVAYCPWLVITNAAELHICVGEPLDALNNECALRVTWVDRFSVEATSAFSHFLLSI